MLEVEDVQKPVTAEELYKCGVDVETISKVLNISLNGVLINLYPLNNKICQTQLYWYDKFKKKNF